MSESLADKSFDLRNPACAYVFGFMQADGHHYAGTGRKGRVMVEIKATDVAVLRAPSVAFSHRDYLRGIWDADGSVGFTGTGMPFLSVVTASPELANFVCSEIKRVTGASRTAKPNRRDGVMNLMLGNDPAAEFARWLYADAAIALDRKRDAALAVAAWTRPESMRARSSHRRWTDAEDAVVLRIPVREAAILLNRSESSVNIRRWRLRNDAA